VKSQVSQHFGEFCQVTESGVTEPGLQAESWPDNLADGSGAEAVALFVDRARRADAQFA
jgi:hypothetical protein